MHLGRSILLTDSALARLLGQGGARAELSRPGVTRSSLGDWLAWRDAIELAAVLDAPAAAPPRTRGDDEEVGVLTRQLEDLRAHLSSPLSVEEIAHAGGPSADTAPRQDIAFGLFRDSYKRRQSLMESSIAALRSRMRAGLRRACLDDVAAIDAVLERVMAPRERQALSDAILDSLRARCHLMAGSMQPDSDGPDVSPCDDQHIRAWLEATVVAELQLRLRPLEALLVALGASKFS